MQPVTASGSVVSAASTMAPPEPGVIAVSKDGNPLSANGMPKKRSHKRRERSEEAVVNVPSPAQASSSLGSRRTRTKVDYKERIDIPGPPETSSEEEDEDEDEEEEAPQEEEVKASRSGRIIKPRSGVSMSALAHMSTATKRESPAPAKKKKKKREKEGSNAPGGDELGGGGRTWLGQDVPAELVLVQAARRHMLPYVGDRQLAKHAQEKQMLVPVRIDLDTDTHRIRDMFVWDLNGMIRSKLVFRGAC